MRLLTSMKRIAVLAALWSCVLPVHQLAASEARTAQIPTADKIVRDVALLAGGSLVGRVVDEQGQPTSTQVVVLDETGREAGSAVSDQDGRFEVIGLRAGTYQVATGGASVPCRCWAERTAPPSASQRLLLVEDASILRGQRPLGEVLFSPPVLLAGIIIAAIAIPIAIHNSQDHDDAS